MEAEVEEARAKKRKPNSEEENEEMYEERKKEAGDQPSHCVLKARSPSEPKEKNSYTASDDEADEPGSKDEKGDWGKA